MISLLTAYVRFAVPLVVVVVSVNLITATTAATAPSATTTATLTSVAQQAQSSSASFVHGQQAGSIVPFAIGNNSDSEVMSDILKVDYRVQDHKETIVKVRNKRVLSVGQEEAAAAIQAAKTQPSSIDLMESIGTDTRPLTMNETLVDLLANNLETSNDTSQQHEDSEPMSRTTFILVILHVSVFITGLVGNSLVCLSVYRNKTLQTVTNYYIVNLAVADFLVILICLPPTVYWDIYLFWNFGLVLCKLIVYLQSISVSVSVLTLTCISIDRWYAICRPLEFSSTKYRAKVTILLIWVMSLLIASPDVIFLTTRPIYEENSTVYSDCTYSWPESNTKIYQLCIVSLLFIGPFVLMSISYSHIVNVLWRNETMAESMANSFHQEDCRKTNESNSAATELRTNLSSEHGKHSKFGAITENVNGDIESQALKSSNQKDLAFSVDCRAETNGCLSDSCKASTTTTTAATAASLLMKKSNGQNKLLDETHRLVEYIDPNLSTESSNQLSQYLANCQCKTPFARSQLQPSDERSACVDLLTNESSSTPSTDATSSIPMQTKHQHMYNTNDNEQSDASAPFVEGHHSTRKDHMITTIDALDVRDSHKTRETAVVRGCSDGAQNLGHSTELNSCVLRWPRQIAIIEEDHESSGTGLIDDKVGGQNNGVEISTHHIETAQQRQRQQQQPILQRQRQHSFDVGTKDECLNIEGRSRPSDYQCAAQFQSISNNFLCRTRIALPDDCEGIGCRAGAPVADEKKELISVPTKDVTGDNYRVVAEKLCAPKAEIVETSGITTSRRSNTMSGSLNGNNRNARPLRSVDSFTGSDFCVDDNTKRDHTNFIGTTTTRSRLEGQKNVVPDTIVHNACNSSLASSQISGLSRPIASNGKTSIASHWCGCIKKRSDNGDQDKYNDRFHLDTNTAKRYRKNLANYAAMKDRCQARAGHNERQVRHNGPRMCTVKMKSLDFGDSKLSSIGCNANCSSGKHEELGSQNGLSKTLTRKISTSTICNLVVNSLSNERDPTEANSNGQNMAANHYLNQGPSSSSQTRYVKLIESRKKAAKMLIVIVTMFGLCYLPVHFLNILRYTIGLPQNDITTIASLVSHWLCYFNSAVNPLIYNFMSGKFRHEFANLFFCKCFRRQ